MSTLLNIKDPAIWPSTASPGTKLDLAGERKLSQDKETSLRCQNHLVDVANYSTLDNTSLTHTMYSPHGDRGMCTSQSKVVQWFS